MILFNTNNLGIYSSNDSLNYRYCLKVVPIIRGFLLAGGEYVDENKVLIPSITITYE